MPIIRRCASAAAMSLAMLESAYGVQYHSQEQVQQLLFPAASSFRDVSFLLTREQRGAIETAAGISVERPRVHVLEARTADRLLGYLLFDEVSGKNDVINYALALTAQGSVAAIEIMAYRETYGEQIRTEHWRRQFVGKSSLDPVRLDTDIRNISGATLSCKHVTDGVRRLLAVFDTAIRKRSS
ncbi:MAG: FMN-binding protein [Massilia sp.]